MRNLLLLTVIFLCFSCSNDDAPPAEQTEVDLTDYFSIDFDNLPSYSTLPVPQYITRDNTNTNPITNEGATLGRILIYDKNLSSDNSTSCSSCHKQAFAFGDDLRASQGVNGATARHSMRLINSRFGEEEHFFWDERAETLEAQTTQPIQDHIEMGFSGTEGDLDFTDLKNKLNELPYYPVLFDRVYGSEEITEQKMQQVLAQFVRSIQSFDSKFDEGLAQTNNNRQPFPNFTTQENQGKTLFINNITFDNNGNRIGGGAGCAICHRAPEFDIGENRRNNGIIETIEGTGPDFTVTRSPTLRDVIKANGSSNGGFMHTGFSNDIMDVIEHYNDIDATGNPTLDGALRGDNGGPGGPGVNGNGQKLHLLDTEKAALAAFLATLAGSDVYTNEIWSDPFK